MEEKLLEAIAKGDYGTCEQLLGRGVNIEATYMEVSATDEDNIRSFVVSCPSVCVQRGCTPLHVSSVRGLVDVVRLLLDRGANIEATDYVCD